MVYGGVKNIYCVAHHQTEEAGLMPMTLACTMVVSKLPSFFIVKVTFYLDFSEVCKLKEH